MKIFHKGKLISSYGKGRKMEGRAKINRRLIAKYKFDNTLYDLIPEFNAEFTDYTYEDVVDGDVTTRTIYSNDLPTLMRFGTSYTSDKANSLLEVYYLNVDNVNNMSLMFKCCSNLTSVNSSDWNTSKVTDMYAMFQYCYKLNTLDVSNWNTSNVTNFGAFLSGTTTKMSINKINGIEKIDVSKATSLQDMFYNCYYLTELDVSRWDTSNVVKMSGLFRYCSSLTELNVSNFNTNKIESIHSIFYDCKLITSLDLSNWNVSNATNANYTFNGCTNLTTLKLNNWNLNSINSNNSMFNTCSNLTYIEIQSSDYNSVNKIIVELPTRTTDSMGTLDIVGIDDISQVDIATLNSKYWTIVSHTILNNARLGQTKLN